MEGLTSPSLSERGDRDWLVPVRIKNKILVVVAVVVRLERINIIF